MLASEAYNISEWILASFSPGSEIQRSSPLGCTEVAIGSVQFPVSVRECLGLSLEHAQSHIFRASWVFSFSSALPLQPQTSFTTDSQEISRWISPVPTLSLLPDGASYSLIDTMVESESQSFTFFESKSYSIQSVEILSFSIVSHSGSELSYTAVPSWTLSASVLRSFVPGFVAVVVYSLVPSRMVVLAHLGFSTPPESAGLSSAVLIGAVGGSGVILSLLIGMAIFLIRSRSRDLGRSEFDKPSRAAPTQQVEEVSESVGDGDHPPKDVPASVSLYEMHEEVSSEEAVAGGALYI
jgi:hypothetical protein